MSLVEELLRDTSDRAVLRELAARQLARRTLLAFVQRMFPRYLPGWVHQELCHKLEVFLERVRQNESPRLLVAMPPRHGKSLLASQFFPAWGLGVDPTLEFISCSYALSLQTGFSRRVRGLLQSAEYRLLFPETELSPDAQNIEGWLTTAGGGFKPAGRGGPISGFGCLAEGTLIATPTGSVAIEQLVASHTATGEVLVMGFHHATGEVKPCRVVATKETRNSAVIRIITSSNRTLDLTPDHRVYVCERGYRAAADLCPGDRLLVYAEKAAERGVPDMREGTKARRYALPRLLPGNVEKLCATNLRLVWEAFRAACRRSAESAKKWIQRHLLFVCVQYRASRHEELYKDVRRVRRPHKTALQILLRNLQRGEPDSESRGAETAQPTGVPELSEAVPAQNFEADFLRRYMPERSSLSSHDGRRKLALPSRYEPLSVVCADAACGLGAGWRAVCGVFRSSHDSAKRFWVAARTSYRRRPSQQCAGKSSNTVRDLPHSPPQITYDTVRLVEPLRHPGVTVYDLQVEGTSNMFAGEILAHNCNILVLDDLIKNAQEAESTTLRDSAWDWYVSTARTRLSPGGGILAVGTRWHHDDPMGRLELGGGEFADEFEVVRYPAIATSDEAHRKAGEPLHPERYDLRELRATQAAVGPGVWEALYQQNPTPEAGGYFDLQNLVAYDKPPELLRAFAAFDLAIGKKERNDYTVGIVGGLSMEGDLFLLDLVHARMDSIAIVDTIFDLHARYNTFLLGIEHGQLGMAIKPLIDARIQATKTYTLAIKDLMPGRSDKEARARTLQGMIRQRRVFVPRYADWVGEMKAEFTQFPNGKHDDMVDAASYLALMVADIPPPRPVKTDATPKWLEKLKIQPDLLTKLTQKLFMGA